MDKNKVNVPKIRFLGFEEEWEQRKLSELLISSDKRNNVGKYTQDDVLAASLGTELVKKHIFFGLRSTEESVKNYRVVNSGDVIYTKSPIKGYPNGIIRTNKGLEGIVPSLYCVYHSISSINSSFIQSYFEDKGRLDAYLHPMVNIGARNNVNITDLGFLEGTIRIPQNIDEQNKIVDFFNHLTSLISLHLRKLEHLKDKKKGLLQKMFPKEGEKFPELRFPGFTEPWKQGKLGQLAKFAKGNGYSKNDLIDQGTPIILYGRLYTKYEAIIEEVDTFVEEKKGSIYSNGNEVIVPASGETSDDISRASAVIKSGILLGGDLNIIYPDKSIDTKFLALTISNGKQQKELSKRAQGKSVVHLHNSDLQEVDLLYPAKDEQLQISNFFIEIDNLITLHQRKLEHLQQQKKGLLQQMFV